MKVKHLLIAAVLISLSVIDMNAAKYTVTNTNDSGAGSLRQAVADANSTPDDDLIVFDRSGCDNGICQIVLTSGNIVLRESDGSSGALTIFNSGGPDTVIVSGDKSSRIFMATGSSVTIDGLTLKNGRSTDGGAILNLHRLRVLNCRLISNYAEYSGGAISSWEYPAHTEIIRTEITGNSSDWGGGIFSMDSSLRILDSTISGNLAEGGGGLALGYGKSAIIANSTLSGNTSLGGGGGMYLYNSEIPAILINTTITENSAFTGGAAFADGLVGGSIRYRNSIIAGNHGVQYPDLDDRYGIYVDLGNNLISRPPMLGPLGHNAGPTRTHALHAGSPAINAGNDCVLTENGCGDGNPALPLDQRGSARAGTVDIGAFERQVTDARAPFDFDGDGRSDVAVFRPDEGVWYLDRSAAGFDATHFGIATDVIVPADYDGDGKTDIAVYRDGTWWRINSSDSTVSATHFGIAGDIPVPADFTGDGRAELAVFRNGDWWSFDLASEQHSLVNFGQVHDRPVPGDYDGDGVADMAIFRPGDGTWWIANSAGNVTMLQFGLGTDRPVAGDYDGDGRTNIAVWRPDDGTWYILRRDLSFYGVQFGTAGDEPAPADYDGDGKYDVAVFRSGNWFINRSTGAVQIHNFGHAGDLPIENAYVR